MGSGRHQSNALARCGALRLRPRPPHRQSQGTLLPAAQTKGNSMTTYLGIDPGIGGGVGLVHDGGLAACWKTPVIKVGGKSHYDVLSMVELLTLHRSEDLRAVIEDVHAMPRQGVSSSFNFGVGFGLWQGMLAALLIPWEKVTPQRWKGEMLAGFTDKTDKGSSRLQARNLFPDLRREFTFVNDDGKAEAVLLAEWRRRRG